MRHLTQICFLVFVFGAVSAQDAAEKAKGFIIVKDSLGGESSTAKCVEFTAYREAMFGIGIRTVAGEEISVRKGASEPPVLYFDFSTASITSTFDLKTMQIKARTLARYAERTPIAEEFVNQEIERLQAAAVRYRNGERLLNGTWISQEELESRMARQEATGLPNLQVKDRTFTNVFAVEQEGLKVRLKHTGGMSLIAVDELTGEQVEALNSVDSSNPKVKLIRYDLEELEKEKEEKIQSIKAQIAGLEKELAEKKATLQDESLERSRQIEAKAAKVKAEIIQRLQDERRDAIRRGKALRERSSVSEDGTLLFRELSQKMRESGQALSFYVSGRMEKKRTRMNGNYEGDSAYLVVFPDQTEGLVIGDSSLFESEGKQSMHLLQVGMATYDTDSGFRKKSPVFVKPGTNAVSEWQDLSRRVRQWEEKAENLRKEAGDLEERVAMIDAALRTPPGNSLFEQFNSLVEEAEAVKQNAAESLLRLDSTEAPERRRIESLQNEIPQISTKYDEQKAELEKTRPKGVSDTSSSQSKMKLIR